MAKYEGIIQLSGKLGEKIFVNKDGNTHVKTKPLSVKRSEASQKSAIDFGEASKSASKIRKALAPLIAEYGDKTLINRLNKRMIEAFKAIPQAGTRNLKDSHLKLLLNFRFNDAKGIDDLWTNIPPIELKPTGLSLQLNKAEFPKTIPKATQFVIQLMVVNLDLIGDNNEIIKAKDLVIPINEQMKPVKLSMPLTLSGDRALIIAIGIHHLANKVKMSNKKYYACDICCAERIKDGKLIAFLVEEQEVLASKPTEDEGVAWEML